MTHHEEECRPGDWHYKFITKQLADEGVEPGSTVNYGGQDVNRTVRIYYPDGRVTVLNEHVPV